MTKSYKYFFLCYPTAAAQKCPGHPSGSQVAGGAGRNQETEPQRRLQAHPRRTPGITKRAAANAPITQCSAARCQASEAGRWLMALVPFIMSGNELRAKAMAGRHTQTRSRIHSGEQKAVPSSGLDTKQHADGAQEERGGGREQKEEQEDSSRCKKMNQGSVVSLLLPAKRTFTCCIIEWELTCSGSVSKHITTTYPCTHFVLSTGYASLCEHDLQNLPPFKTSFHSTQKKNWGGKNWDSFKEKINKSRSSTIYSCQSLRVQLLWPHFWANSRL